MFGKFERLVEKLFILLKCLKSQKKITLEDFLDKLVDFIVAWDDIFPNCSEFNKLHMLKAHFARFIQIYQMCGRVAAEAHESIHAHLAKVRTTCCRMVSITQQNKTLYARALANLKPGVADDRSHYNEKAKGKKRQKYNVTNKNRLQDQNDVSSTIFVDSPITVDGEEYLTLVSGGRIPSRLSEVFLYVKHGVAPDDWIKAFQETGMLSESKVEDAKYSTH